MPDEPVVVRGINWKETFPFTLIFRSFRIAIHPSKLVLALLALLAIYVGGRILDGIWPAQYLAVPEEVGIYESVWARNEPGQFDKERDAARKEIDDAFRAKLNEIGKPNGSFKDIKWSIVDRRDKAANAARDAYEKSDKSADALRRRDDAIRAEYQRAYDEVRYYELHDGVGLFRTFYDFEIGQVNQITRAIRNGNWLGRAGVFEALLNFFIIGPSWAIRHHWLYFTLFGLFFLMVWAIFGGAIARIAAVHVARDEKISIRQALSFSTSKFLSFISAPIIPLLIVVVVGLIVAIGGFLGNIPVLGPILIGTLFFLALAAGFVMTLVLLGLAGGFNLMYPTIAVEGSDSFDAISRSFSYLYARPWRLAFYTIIAIVYGAITYTFVRFFIYLLLYLTHTFAGMFFFAHADSTAPLWNTMWPNPLVNGRLVYDVDFLTLGPAQDIGAGLLSFWIYLTIGMLGAFAISFYFSSNTIIYFLMRHEVDATELDDVYLEQSDEDFADSAAATASAAPAGAVESSGVQDQTSATIVTENAPPPPNEQPPPDQG
jgi:hypothetical protein